MRPSPLGDGLITIRDCLGNRNIGLADYVQALDEFSGPGAIAANCAGLSAMGLAPKVS